MTETILTFLKNFPFIRNCFCLVCVSGPLVFIFYEALNRKKKEGAWRIEDDDLVTTSPSPALASILYNHKYHFLSLFMTMLTFLALALGYESLIYLGIACFCFVSLTFIFFGIQLWYLQSSKDKS